MKINGKQRLPGHIGRRSLVLLAVLAIMLSAAGIVGAQPQSADDKFRPASATASTKTAAGAAATVIKAEPQKRAADGAAPPRQSAAEGRPEGIKVHGHWIIEVKTPDGTVVKHVEFENALTPEGRFLIARDLLGRNLTVGTWGIGLGLSSPTGTSPCTAQMTYRNAIFIRGIGRFPNACYIAESLANANLPVSDSDGNIQGSVVSGCQIPVNCSNNLVAGSEDLGDILTPAFTVSGSVVAAQSGTIDTVATFNSACGGSVSPANCLGSPTDPPQIFTQASLPSAAALGIPAQQPIVVAQGQIISVTVVINFS